MRQRAWIWLGAAMALALLEQFVVRGLMHEPMGDEPGAALTQVPPIFDVLRWLAVGCLAIGIVVLVWDTVQYARKKA
jgi:heme exporter protein D